MFSFQNIRTKQYVNGKCETNEDFMSGYFCENEKIYQGLPIPSGKTWNAIEMLKH